MQLENGKFLLHCQPGAVSVCSQIQLFCFKAKHWANFMLIFLEFTRIIDFKMCRRRLEGDQRKIYMDIFTYIYEYLYI